MKIYGIPNCDIMKKAFDHLKGKNIAYEFHDYKKSGINKEKLKEWCKEVGWETLLNKRSTTWKELDDTIQKKTTDEATAIKVMMEHNSIIKRPVLETGKALIIGFDAKQYSEL